jgi:hypothetical protein
MTIPIDQTDRMYWEGLDFTLSVGSELTDSQRDVLEKIVGAWYVLGGYGAFTGEFHMISAIGFNANAEGVDVEWRVDMGTAPECALDVLIRALEGFAELEGLNVTRLVLGTRTV